MSWLDAFFTTGQIAVFASGVALPTANGLDIYGAGQTTVFDAATGRAKLTVPGADVLPQGAGYVDIATTEPITRSGIGQVIDGYTTQGGDRVLDKDDVNPIERGVYVVASGTWARATDFDSSTTVRSGVQLFTRNGTDNGGVTFKLEVSGAVVVDTTPLVFTSLLTTRNTASAMVIGRTDAISIEGQSGLQGMIVLPDFGGNGGTVWAFGSENQFAVIGPLTPDTPGPNIGTGLTISGGDAREANPSDPNNDGLPINLEPGKPGTGGTGDGEAGPLVIGPSGPAFPKPTAGLIRTCNPEAYADLLWAIENRAGDGHLAFVSADADDQINIGEATQRLALVGSRVLAGKLYLRPAGGSTDDWERLFDPSTGIATLATAAGIGVHLLGGFGNWRADSVQSIPSGLDLSADSSVIIASTIANGTGNTDCVFFAGAITGDSTTLSANVTVLSRTLALTSRDDFPQNTRLAVGSSNRFMYYTVVSATATGAGNITVDRPILYDFQSGDTVFVITEQPTNIRLIGNGATIQGTGARAIEIGAGLDCLVQGWNIDATTGFGGIVASFDIGSENCHFRDIHIVGGYDAQGGIALESAESCTAVDCTIVNVATSAAHIGLYMTDCVQCHAVRVYSTRNVIGFSLEGAVSTYGCRWCTVSSSMAVGNSNDGIRVINGCQAVSLLGCSALSNGQHGINGANSSTFVVSNCDGSSNTGSGVNWPAGTIVRVVGAKAYSNAVDGITAFGDGAVTACDVRLNAAHGIDVGGAANVAITACTMSPAASGYSTCIYSASTGNVEIADITLDSANASAAAVQIAAAGRISLNNLRVTGGGYGFYTTTAGAIVKRGTNVDFKAATTPWTLTNASPNFGLVTLNGATPVDFNYPDVHADSLVTLTLVTVHGTQGLAPSYTKTAGTKISVAGIALDTSDYQVWIN